MKNLTVKDKLKKIKYYRSTPLGKFLIDLDCMVLTGPKEVEQLFRDEFADGSMILTVNSIIGNITMSEFPRLFKFIEEHFGIKYTIEI